jgi:hypothetical protein
LEEVGIEVLKLMWVSVQFCAKNLLSWTALNYTGKFQLVHKVQQRTLRAWSIDSHYVSAAYTYKWSYGVWLNNLLEDVHSDLTVVSASCDDKCKVASRKIYISFGVCLYVHNADIIFQYRSLSERPHYPFSCRRGTIHLLCRPDASLLPAIMTSM